MTKLPPTTGRPHYLKDDVETYNQKILKKYLTTVRNFIDAKKQNAVQTTFLDYLSKANVVSNFKGKKSSVKN